MRFVYLVTAGAGDPVRASLPFHLAVNGSLEVATTWELCLPGTPPSSWGEGVVDSVEGLGLAPARPAD